MLECVDQDANVHRNELKAEGEGLAPCVSLPESLVNRLYDLPPVVQTLCDRHELLEKRLIELMSVQDDSTKRVCWRLIADSPRDGPNPRIPRSPVPALPKEDTLDINADHFADAIADEYVDRCMVSHSSVTRSSIQTSEKESSYKPSSRSRASQDFLQRGTGNSKDSQASLRARNRRLMLNQAQQHPPTQLSTVPDTPTLQEPQGEKPQRARVSSLQRVSQELARVSSHTIFSLSANTQDKTESEIQEVVDELRSVTKQVTQATKRRTKKKLSYRSELLETYGEGYHFILARIVTHPLFDSACACMILLNSLLIGWSTDYLASHDSETWVLVLCGHLCSLFFLVELVLRMALHGSHFFWSEDKFWNIFDFILVTFSIVDFILETASSGGEGASVGSSMRTIKMLRIVRIFRVFRFFSDLTVLVLMISESFKSLLWALIMLSLIIYVFAICFTAGATEYLKSEKEPHRIGVSLKFRFGSLSRSVNSLVLSMLNGVSWGEVSGPLEKVGWVMAGLFFFYIFFTMFAVLNIITGVFVDNAVQTANNHRDYLVEKYMEVKENYLELIREMFEDMDEDESGSITLEELHKYFRDHRMRSYFQVLGLDAHDCDRLFRLLDEDNSGAVSIDEFLTGCLRLKGDARSIDLHFLIYECKDILAGVNALLKHSGLATFGDFRLCRGSTFRASTQSLSAIVPP